MKHAIVRERARPTSGSRFAIRLCIEVFGRFLGVQPGPFKSLKFNTVRYGPFFY